MIERQKMMPTAISNNQNNTTEESMGNTYSTTDLSLSAFLQARGHQLVDVLNDRGRGTFVFADTEQLRRDILKWGNNELVSIHVRGFVNLMRDLKGMVGV